MSKRQQRQNLDHAAHPFTFLRRMQKALQQADCLVNAASLPVAFIPGNEHSSQRHVLELTQVAGRIVNGKAPFTYPLQSFGQFALHNPDPGFHGRYGTEVRQGWSDV